MSKKPEKQVTEPVQQTLFGKQPTHQPDTSVHHRDAGKIQGLATEPKAGDVEVKAVDPLAGHPELPIGN